MPKSQLAAALLVLVGCGAIAGCTPRRAAPPSPMVLPDVSGHTALLIDHVGTYELASEPVRRFSLPHTQLAISPSISCHVTWRSEPRATAEVPGDPKLVRLQAALVVETVRRPILAGYDLRWTRFGPDVVGLSSGEEPPPRPPFPCPGARQEPPR